MVVLRSCSTNRHNGDAAAKLKRLCRACLRLIMEASRNNWNQGVYPKRLRSAGKVRTQKNASENRMAPRLSGLSAIGGRGRYPVAHHRVGINRKILFVQEGH